ncbi:MAG: VWA domain-containing protein, partial [Acidimicrobiales bacterium]
MSFANPAALWFALLALPIIALHVLRPRRTQHEVSSVLLWASEARPVSAASPWQRLRPSALLALQLLAVLLLAGAAARPYAPTEAPLAEHTVFIVDVSGSMAARDGKPDRLAAAKDAARALRGQAAEGALASLVVAGVEPRVVLSASPDRGAFDSALKALQTGTGAADFLDAFALAESLETDGVQIGFVLISDGRMSEVERRAIPPGAHYVKVGDRAANRGVVRLTAEQRGGGLHARATLANTGGPAVSQSVRFDVDGVAAQTVTVDLDEGRSTDLDVDLPAGDRVEVFLEGEDLLAADDHAYAVVARRREVRVLHVGPPNPFLEDALGALGDVTLDEAELAPGTAGDPAAVGYDLAVYDQVDPPAEPGAPFLAIAPPAGLPAAGVASTGTVDTPAVALVDADDPLVAGLDLADVGIAAAQRVTAPSSAEVLLGAEGAPLLLRTTVGGRTALYLAFPLAESNLPLQVAFPVLVGRVVDELAGGELPAGGFVVGQTAPVDRTLDTTLLAPGGRELHVAAGAPAPMLDRAGFWVLRSPGRADASVAVNADPAESSLAPAGELPIPPRAGRPGEAAPGGRRPLLRWAAAALAVVLALEWLAARRAVGVPRRQWQAAQAARALVAVGVALAALGVALPRASHRMAVVFALDGSESLGPGGQAEAAAWVRAALAQRPAGARAAVVSFGGDARLASTLRDDGELDLSQVRIDRTRTDLAAALRLAAAVLPQDARRRVVLVSDGRANKGDALAEAAKLGEAGAPLDVATAERAGGVDAAVTALKAPSHVREGERFTVTATVAGQRAGPAEVVLRRAGVELDRRRVEPAAGPATVEFAEVAGGAGGLERYQVEVVTPGDSVQENNQAFVAVQVEGPPKVLVAEGAPDEGAAVAAALRAGGLVVDVTPAAALPGVTTLAGYASIVLVDADRRALSDAQVAALAAAVRDLGRGLVTLGGPRAYGPGAYLDSDLEALLPVVSEITDPLRRQSVAEVLAIDTSGSMGACHCSEGANGIFRGNRLPGGVNKTDISREGAARAIEALRSSDEVGVLALSTHDKWILDLQKVPPGDVVAGNLAAMAPVGGTDLSTGLLTAAQALRSSKSSLKHIILFTDGFTEPRTLATLAEQAGALAAEGITVSVVATGEGASRELAKVAEAGQGRFYPGRDLEEIPQIIVDETVIASRSFINEGEFLPEVTSAAMPVSRLTASPPLRGYVAATTKATAATLLRIGPEADPLLASWQVGLGRATAWTSDAGAQWAQLWAAWPGFVEFWTGVVKDTFPQAGAAGAGVQASVADGVLRLRVESAGAFPDGAGAVARITNPDLSAGEVTLRRVADDAFEGEAPAPLPGSYAVGVLVEGPDGAIFATTALASESYSPEFTPGPAEPAVLARLSALAGGRGEITPEQVFDTAGAAPGTRRLALAAPLLLAAALLWRS